MKKCYIDLPDGQIHYITAGQGPTVLLLHQSPMSSAEWDEIIPALANDYTVIAPDMAGHGQSYDPIKPLAVEDFRDLTLLLMDKLNLLSVMLVGNHSGAALATAIAVHSPQRVKKIVISCEMLSSAPQIEAFIDSLRKKSLTREIPFDADGKFIADAWKRYEMLAPRASLEKRYKPFIIGQAARLKPYDIHHCVLEWMSKEEWVTKLQCPVLVFGAENDLFYNQEQLTAATKRIKDCSIITIKNAGALSTFEQPVAFSDMLLAFLTNN